MMQVGVTLLNKAAFAGKGAASFQYPYTLSAVHMGINWAGSVLALKWMQQERKKIARVRCTATILFLSGLLFSPFLPRPVVAASVITVPCSCLVLFLA
jgi:hypothetical protein